MDLIRLYKRALGMLGAEKALAILLAAASVVIGLVQLAEPILFGRVVDALARGEGASQTIALWAALGLFGIFASVVVAVYADRLAHRRHLAAMAEAFERAMTLPQGYHADRGSGAVVRSILQGTDSLFWLWLGAMREQLTAVAGIVLLVPTAIGMDIRMAAILAVLAIAYVVMNAFVMRKTKEGQSNVEQYNSAVYGRVGDVIGNVTVVQSFARLKAESDAMRSVMSDLLAAQYPVLTWWGILTVLQRAAATIAMVAVFAMGAVLAGRGELTVGQIVSFVGFANLLISKLDQISGFVTAIHRRAPVLKAYFDLIDEPDGIVEKPGAPPLPAVSGEVKYEHVSFRFPGTEQGVHDIELKAAPGQTIALVGPTGSGKSTTLSLLMRLRAPEQGRILIDDRDIADVTLASLRQSIAVVFQDAGLFNRSIGDNIAIGRPGATLAEVETAARLAEAHDFIARKPGGYGFVIGERGVALSGGERQRIAIARAILKDAPILVLDEATSALDAETEARIKRALDRLRENRTTFIIAHRLSTVANADEILVLDQGRIVERGRFRELAEGKGIFARMVAEGGFTVPKAPEQDISKSGD
ncbi:glucan ABC transporter ATP-binding protein/ permease [Hyphomicrobium sp.]|uniref:glucan ABC transporter ATP-binding protein/ permease n=1 Tax=Hyphomicrobium sp. TaxID=82 RepID=UPI002E31B067|nr:glucan ABC transporter ATP-binding protein/ permease [Hyphomicrobium sp.]HEX2843094.1 glucan ABC transporter ATP-binding protein/ permease [Hyphomicrobium sp.]